MTRLSLLTALALTCTTVSAACAQSTSRPSGENAMTTSKAAASQVETATFALG